MASTKKNALKTISESSIPRNANVLGEMFVLSSKDEGTAFKSQFSKFLILCRANPLAVSPSPRVFIGDGDVQMFFFFYENVVTRGQDEGEKTLKLLLHINGLTFHPFFKKFTIGSAVCNAGKNYIPVKAAFLKKFPELLGFQDIIRQATDCTVDEKNLVLSLGQLDALYKRACFNDDAKFWVLCVAVTKIPQVMTFAMY